MLREIRVFLLGFLTLILFSTLGVAIAFVAVSGWIRLESTGIFVKWQLLDSPYEFKHLTYANQNEVVAQAEDGKNYIYYSGPCDGVTNRKCGAWAGSPSGLEFDGLTKSIVKSGCKSAYEYYAKDTDYNYGPAIQPRYPPQGESTPRECVISLEHHPLGGATLTYYVLLENGKVWKWILKATAAQYVATTLRWILVGLLIGIITWFGFLNFLSRNRSHRAN